MAVFLTFDLLAVEGGDIRWLALLAKRFFGASRHDAFMTGETALRIGPMVIERRRKGTEQSEVMRRLRSCAPSSALFIIVCDVITDAWSF